MTHPKEVAAFIAWSKAMVQGAQVERPKWKQVKSRKQTFRGKRRKRRNRRKRRKEE